MSKPIWEVAADLAAAVPDEEWAKVHSCADHCSFPGCRPTAPGQEYKYVGPGWRAQVGVLEWTLEEIAGSRLVEALDATFPPTPGWVPKEARTRRLTKEAK